MFITFYTNFRNDGYVLLYLNLQDYACALQIKLFEELTKELRERIVMNVQTSYVTRW
jgi:hypothetical protein